MTITIVAGYTEVTIENVEDHVGRLEHPESLSKLNRLINEIGQHAIKVEKERINAQERST